MTRNDAQKVCCGVECAGELKAATQTTIYVYVSMLREWLVRGRCHTLPSMAGRQEAYED